MLKKVFSLVLLGVCALGASGLAMTLDEALALYRNDHIAVTFTDEGREQLLEVIAALRGTLGVTDALNEENEDRVMEFAVDASLKDVVNKLSQAYYTLANVFYTPETNLPTYLKGKHWGLKSLRMNPGFAAIEGPDRKKFVDAVAVETDVAAMYWTTSNWLRVAQKDKLTAIFAGVPAKTQAMSERCLALDPGYVAGGSYRSLGAYYAGLPAGMGQDLDKALEYLCNVVTQPVCSACATCPPAAIAGADAYFENRTFLAEFYYMEKGMWAEAAAILEAVLAEPVGEAYPLMNAYAQWHAQSLLATVRSHL